MTNWFDADKDGLRQIGERLIERRGFGIVGAELYERDGHRRQYHHWPADVVRRGLRLFAFDPVSRCLRVLLEVTRGGAFTYRTRHELAAAVRAAAGWLPNRQERYWQEAPVATGKARCTGVALRWTVVKFGGSSSSR